MTFFRHLLLDSAPTASEAAPQAGAPQPHQRKITRYQVFGRAFCVQAFQRVWGVGTARFRAVRKGVCAGASGPYLDGRYRASGPSLDGRPGRPIWCLGEVTSFLEELYETEAEYLPENVEGVDAPWKKRPRG